MRHVTRRKWDVFWLGAAAVLTGAAATVGALVGDTERIGNYWMHAKIGVPVSDVTEVIDYDFGPRSRRGILRNIPDVSENTVITVTSPTAPDDLRVTGSTREARLRVGDPNITITGRHRYTIEYTIPSLVEGDRMSWNAVGTEWDVPINNAEIHITADREFTALECDRGRTGDTGGCGDDQVAPGHLLVEVSGLSDGEGVTVSAVMGAQLEGLPELPLVPTGPADDPGTGWLVPGLVALAGALGASGITSRMVRNLGREQVWEGGAADAAFGPRAGDVVGVQLIDHDDLADMATIEFEAPRGLSAAAGGIIHDESVSSEHQIAWLIEAAIRNEVELEDKGGTRKKMTLHRGSAPPHHAVAERLDDLFGGRNSIELGTYDERFAKAWGRLKEDLEAWRKSSGLWDPAGRHRRNRARLFGALAALAGLGLAFLGGVLANRAGAPWLVIAVVGGLVAGAGLSALLRSWELLVRTAEGSGRWLQVESFRRFIEASEARHAEAAAKRGLLRHYTAWAVALGELDHWEEVVEAAAQVPGSATRASASDFAFVAMAPTLSRATAQTFTAPSSSGSGGGGGGGGVGGGGGGGGGGSW